MVRDVMVRWTIYATVFGLLIGGVAHGAHFAGLAAGALLGAILPAAGQVAARRRLSPFLATAAVGLAIGSLVMCGQWYAADRPVPAELGLGDRVFLMESKAERDGWDAVLPAEAVALFDDARALRKAGYPADEMKAFEGRFEGVMKGLDRGQQLLVARRVERRLYPNGRRGVDPHDPQR